MGLSDHPHASVGAGERLVLYVSSPHGEGAVQGTYNQHGNKAMSYTEGWPPKMVTMVPRIRTTLSFGLKTVLTCFCLIALLQLLQMVILLEYSPSNKLGDISLLLPLSTYGLANPWVDGDGSQRQQFMIPRLIHQTYRDERLPVKLLPLLESWTQRNRGWQRRFYTDEDCTRFVQDEFPQYYRAYRALPKDVERADFFRYMIILRHGGVYADIDVESRRPLESYILPTDSMVVGWEAEAPNDVEAFNHHYVRKRQVLQWFFAAAAGHPVLKAMCDHIANNMLTTFSNNTNIDTLERTGPGPWTDLVLRHSLQVCWGSAWMWASGFMRVACQPTFGALRFGVAVMP